MEDFEGYGLVFILLDLCVISRAGVEIIVGQCIPKSFYCCFLCPTHANLQFSNYCGYFSGCDFILCYTYSKNRLKIPLDQNDCTTFI